MLVETEGTNVRFGYRRTPNAVRLLAMPTLAKEAAYEPGKLFNTVGRMGRAVEAVGGKLDGQFPDRNQIVWLTTLHLLSLGFDPLRFGIQGQP